MHTYTHTYIHICARRLRGAAPGRPGPEAGGGPDPPGLQPAPAIVIVAIVVIFGLLLLLVL